MLCDLVEIEKIIALEKLKHNNLLKELGLSLLPQSGPNNMRLQLPGYLCVSPKRQIKVITTHHSTEVHAIALLHCGIRHKATTRKVL